MFKSFSSAHKTGSLVIKNRLVRSATYECMATVEDGSVTQELIYLYKTLGEGGVGLIITGLTYVHPSGRSYHNQTAIDNDNLIPGLRKITETVHEYGDGCRIAIQLAHSGFQSLLENTIAPSAVLEQMMNNMPREMTVKEIEEIIEAFAKSVWRAKEAGFDAVHLPNKWLKGTGGLTAECISCNGCIGVVAQEGVHCTQI